MTADVSSRFRPGGRGIRVHGDAGRGTFPDDMTELMAARRASGGASTERYHLLLCPGRDLPDRRAAASPRPLPLGSPSTAPSTTHSDGSAHRYERLIELPGMEDRTLGAAVLQQPHLPRARAPSTTSSAVSDANGPPASSCASGRRRPCRRQQLAGVVAGRGEARLASVRGAAAVTTTREEDQHQHRGRNATVRGA